MAKFAEEEKVAEKGKVSEEKRVAPLKEAGDTIAQEEDIMIAQKDWVSHTHKLHIIISLEHDVPIAHEEAAVEEEKDVEEDKKLEVVEGKVDTMTPATIVAVVQESGVTAPSEADVTNAQENDIDLSQKKVAEVLEQVAMDVQGGTMTAIEEQYDVNQLSSASGATLAATGKQTKELDQPDVSGEEEKAEAAAVKDTNDTHARSFESNNFLLCSQLWQSRLVFFGACVFIGAVGVVAMAKGGVVHRAG
ncbi:hypothetical protein QBC35DRAFT_537586 [Podospora australis]|uniref:Uncharacterized protein n=1 Tax=Podospora australis TaxID=1536484 RepID=A0AAN6X0D4_9PEZI|nr:hypothetical protein QBC35DRAFT_537586 [Podospora australis]